MVKGLDVFRTWFKDHSDQYVLIGGTRRYQLNKALDRHVAR